MQLHILSSLGQLQCQHLDVSAYVNSEGEIVNLLVSTIFPNNFVGHYA